MDKFNKIINFKGLDQIIWIFLSTGERVIIVTGCNNALVSKVSGAFIENIYALF